MISLIQIRNFTIVDELSLDLSKGMTVLTGETGAGKSILLDALNLTLGGRGDSKLIRNGSEKAEVTVAFSISNTPDAKKWLSENELQDEDSNVCIIRRVLNRDAATKSFINNRLTTVQSLRELGDMLVDIHGQHAHQSLMKRDLQRQALDDFGQHLQLCKEVKTHYQHLQNLRNQQKTLLQQGNEREAKLELLDYQVTELNQLDLQENEIEALDTEQRQLANITSLRESGEKVLYILKDADDNATLTQLDTVIHLLEQSAEFDQTIAGICQQFTSVHVQIQEAESELRQHVNGLSFDVERLTWIDDRLSSILELSRKHRTEPEQLRQLHQDLIKEMDSLQQSSDQAGQLDQKISEALELYTVSANNLSKQRLRAAKRLSKDVSDKLQFLGMQHGQFKVHLETLETPSASGLERIEFQVSTNPGQAMDSLIKIASGGELSRISLAIQVITAATSRIPCLIFDEVDVGIGGGTAEVVGRLLKSLSEKRQVLCITHQAQVASLAEHHLLVSKVSSKKSTSSSVIKLNKKQRTDEIARMIGGIDITAQTRSHAKEMLDQANPKQLETV